MWFEFLYNNNNNNNNNNNKSLTREIYGKTIDSKKMIKYLTSILFYNSEVLSNIERY